MRRRDDDKIEVKINHTERVFIIKECIAFLIEG